MKRLVLTYLGCMVVIFGLPVLVAMIPSAQREGKLSLPTPLLGESILPAQINVYFSDEGVTRPIDLEEYVKGVVPAEIPALFHPEAQKAQAVAARTYAYYKYLSYENDEASRSAEHPDAHICTNPTHCSAYYSPQKLKELHGQQWIEDYLSKIHGYVDATQGEILVYDNEPILAVFHSASANGATESSADVWGEPLPYLVSVKSSGEEQKQNYITSVSVGCSEFASAIKAGFPKASFPKDRSRWIGKTTRTEGGYVESVVIGGEVIKGTQVRSMFGLYSACFDISFEGESIVFTVKGAGHGVGMSQYGANHMAKQGKGYKEILESYYSGATVVRY
ncbi:MAG: Amidase enhancer precursor [Firmicutes bacterium ADurb.Bin193]|nr:MAG: Amidase enhancer precursor [Firmicutes bacterium ADurb.Bin193]